MIIPPISGVTGGLSPGQAGLTQAALSGGGTGAATSGSLGATSNLSEAPGLGASAGVGEAGSLPAGGSVGVEGAGGGESFGGALTEAISSLEKTQQASDSASQALATGTVKDPASAVVTVEDAQLSMQLASQIRTKATEAAQSIFQTQV